MESSRNLPAKHLPLLGMFCVGIIFVWMVPVLLAGFPFWIPSTLRFAQEFTATGVLSEPMLALVVLVFRALHPFIDWQNITGWTAANAVIFALSLPFLWWSMFRLFDARIAWITVVIYSFMPMSWYHAVRISGGPLALLFLFFGTAVFLSLFPRRRIFPITFFAVCFGLALASSHAFVTFLPWLVVSYLWCQRRYWKRAIPEVFLFCAVAYVAFVAPLTPNALQEGMTPVQRFEVFLPSVSDHTTTIGHLYPDEYTYLFLRDEYDEQVLDQAEHASFLERQDEEYVRIIFGVGSFNFFERMGNGLWLFAHSLPPLFQEETVGGAFLWLFILPGIVFLYRKRRGLLMQFVGLWLTMQFLLRFIFHYRSEHLFDVGWMIAIFAAVGIASLGKTFQSQSKRLSVTAFSLIVVLLVSAQMVQANRKLFARLYAKTTVPTAIAAAKAFAKIPADAVVAHPRKGELFDASDRKQINIALETIQYLAERDRIREPFVYYGVTHIIGYPKDIEEQIVAALPAIDVVTYDAVENSIPITPFKSLLLHAIR